MNRPHRTMTEIRRMIGEANTARNSALATADIDKPLMSTTEVQATLNQQVSQLDLGFIGNLRARMFQRGQDGRMQRTLTAARAEEATGLMLKKLKGEVQIIQMQFDRDFSDRIAALAESAAASQIMVMRKLKAIEGEARNFVMYDLKRETEKLENMLNEGVIDEAYFTNECAFRMARYEELRGRFSAMLDGYQANVQNTFKGDAR